MNALSYLDSLDFTPDIFQIEAAQAIDAGATVVVTAPTGAGKTVVAGAAIARALDQGRRAFYTTPIKALSNQKYSEFLNEHGAGNVGLLTGDNSINGAAPVVVMTTEVLRNMMYAGSADIEDVGVVVLDEVHYLQDRERGAVWEEIIIHLDPTIPLVCLSATLANAGEFAAWIRERRGDTVLVVEEERPVPLEVTYLVRDRFAGHELRLLPAFSGSRGNERLRAMLRRDRGRRSRYVAPRRHETSELLQRSGLLPAIYFVFSRKGCEAAARTVVERGLRLTTPDEAREIVEFADRSAAHVAATDLDVLGYTAWRELLAAGVSPHHAGMVPLMKETVERLFAAGLVKLVFATETLALGLNMPARSVVLESLSKFSGEAHEALEPGDFTQLTGRAGRRGIDTEGTAVVLHSPYFDFDRVIGIAGRGSHPLRSSFRPNYNMAVNLVARYRRTEAERLVQASFAEFARSRRHESEQRAIADDEALLNRLREEAEHPQVDIWAEVAKDGQVLRSRLAAFVATTGPGDVLEWEGSGGVTRVVVIAVGVGKQPRILAVTRKGETRRFASGKFPATLRRIGRIELTPPFRPRHASYRAQVARTLGSFAPSGDPELAVAADSSPQADISANLRAAREALRVQDRLVSRRRRSATLGTENLERLQAILGVLEKLGYLRGWELTTKGNDLRGVYNELDLTLAEALHSGVFTGADPPALAALASSFTYRARRDNGAAPWPVQLRARGEQLDGIVAAIARLEAEHGLPQGRAPDPGIAATVAAWAQGAGLGSLFGDEEAQVGDFVRNIRQLVDLLRQIRDLNILDEDVIDAAVAAIDRGVVAVSGLL